MTTRKQSRYTTATPALVPHDPIRAHILMENCARLYGDVTRASQYDDPRDYATEAIIDAYAYMHHIRSIARNAAPADAQQCHGIAESARQYLADAIHLAQKRHPKTRPVNPAAGVDVCHETAYGTTQRLSFSIRVF